MQLIDPRTEVVVFLYDVLLHFLFVYLYLCGDQLSKCGSNWNSNDPENNFSFHAFIMNNKLLLYLYLYL